MANELFVPLYSHDANFAIILQMKKVNLEAVLRKAFDKRPDEAYSFEEVFQQFQRWRSEAFLCTRGEICVSAGAAATHFMTVVSGVLHVKVPSMLGEDIILRVVRPGEYVGLTHVFAPQETYSHDVVAATETTIITCSVKEVRKWRTDPKSLPLYDYLGRLLSDVCRESQTKAMILSGTDIADRLRRYLAVRMQKEGSRTIAFPGTAGDLAHYLGVNRCAFSRVVGKLRAEGVIDVRRNVITMLK